jgi:dTDP-4-dehydrorhamnose reductase
MFTLITGSNGQLAKALIKELHKREKYVVAYDHASLDIQNLGAIRDKLDGVHCIINTAAYNHVDLAETHVEDAISVNALGPRNLAIVAEAHDIPLVHFSTDYVFDGEKRTPYTIADLPNPINAYGKSKLQHFCRRHFVIRLSWVFGSGVTNNFVQKILSCASQKEIKVVTDQMSCPSYTTDLAPAILDLIKTKEYGLYHLTNSGFCSRHEWASYILKNSTTRVFPDCSDSFSAPARRLKFSALNSFPLSKLPTWQDAMDRYLAEIGRLK